MCGIAGKISWSQAPNVDQVRAMTGEMWRRGPDADGFFSNNFVAFGHRRLAIIDLSETGRQPMADHTSQYWITFNGEIYNFGEVRRELEQSGAQFRSTSDTEVILEAYKRWGDECLQRFNGMFAFALWDNLKQRCLLARDRFGKKPLFYAVLGNGDLIFASELKALLRSGLISWRLNTEALSQYLSLGYVLSNACILDGVKKLEPASAMVVERDRPIRIWRYWDLARLFSRKVKITESDAAAELRHLLNDSTRLRMISDVPLGAFLSGGIDSSSIVASMCQNSAAEQVETYSIGFAEKGYSELAEAGIVARHLGVSHHEQNVDVSMAKDLADIVYAADEPFADNSMVPTFYLSAFARRSVTVALTGDGGDELFAGYETYLADKLHHLASRMPRFSSLFGAVATRWLPVTFNKVSWDYKARKFFQASRLPFSEAHYHWRTIFTEAEKRSLLKPEYAKSLDDRPSLRQFDKFFNEVPDCHFLDQAMYVDVKTWLVDDILVKADRMSMAHSLELRSPLLDYRIAEFAASLPTDLKLKGFQKKYILKRSQTGILPHSTIHRKKRGFNAPVAHWLESGLQDLLVGAFKESPVNDIINVGFVESLLKAHRQRTEDASFKLFNLLTLAFWMNSASHKNSQS